MSPQDRDSGAQPNAKGAPARSARSRTSDLEQLQLARELISRWMGLLRAARLYDCENDAVTQAAAAVLEISRRLGGADGDLELRIRHDAIFAGGDRIKEGALGSSVYHEFIDMLRCLGLVALCVEADTTPEELGIFAALFVACSRGDHVREELEPLLGLRGVRHVTVERSNTEDDLPDEIDQEAIARRVYLRSIGVVKNVFHTMRSSGRINARIVKRVVQQMVESVDHGYIQNLTSLKNFDEYTFNHSVNVSVLAIALGRQIGLSRRQLCILGQTGMLHDIGKLCVPIEVLNKPGKLTPEEFDIIRNHPVDGFVSIAARLGVYDDTISVALGAFQHHLNPDGSGYPEAARGSDLGLLSRVVAIVDRYDAMTTPRVYRRQGIPPAKALSIIYHKQGSQTDDVLTRYFMNLIGAVPLGTTVRLSDDTIGIVVAGHASTTHGHLPTVRLVLDAAGHPIDKEVVDLAARAKGPEPLTVVEAVDPARYGIEIMDYLL